MWSVDWRSKRIIIIIIIIIIRYHSHVGYLPLFTCNSHVSRVYSVAATLYLLFTLHVMLFPMLKSLYFHIIIIIIIIIIFVIGFTRGIYNNIPQTHRVSRVYINADFCIYNLCCM
jgi:hypothetical protein